MTKGKGIGYVNGVMVEIDFRTEAAKQTEEVMSRVKAHSIAMKPERNGTRHNRRWRHK